MSQERSAEFLRGAVAALQRKPYSAYTTSILLTEYQSLLAAAEAREAFPIPDTLPEVPEAREAGEKTTSTLPEVSTGGVRMSGNTTDQPTAAEVIAAAETALHMCHSSGGEYAPDYKQIRAAIALISRWKEANGGK